MHERTGALEIVRQNRVTVKKGCRYFVNVGSAGQPRDANPDACAVILDEETGTIEFLRIPYDISACQNKIIAEGLPSYLAERLLLAR
jgi:diadenosine tetraphosphatase ApaH/serine/threonine PP2A family protein phosphatase